MLSTFIIGASSTISVYFSLITPDVTFYSLCSYFLMSLKIFFNSSFPFKSSASYIFSFEILDTAPAAFYSTTILSLELERLLVSGSTDLTGDSFIIYEASSVLEAFGFLPLPL